MLKLLPQNTALLVIDVQWDFWRIKLPQVPPALFLKKLKKLIGFCREKGIKVIYIKHVSRSEMSTYFNEGTEGVEIMEEIKPLDDEAVIVKHSPGAFFNTNLQELLKENNIDSLLITGLMTDHCCDTTTREAHALAYRNYFINDCTATFDMKDREGNNISREEIQRIELAILSNGFATCLNSDELMDCFQSND
ncbi:MAG: cysteine hydrolase [Alkaliphilus sp.]|nr:cysteine hydrolase [Alkaliphilus sp.]